MLKLTDDKKKEAVGHPGIHKTTAGSDRRQGSEGKVRKEQAQDWLVWGMGAVLLWWVPDPGVIRAVHIGLEFKSP
jgi:hypothetical protein